MEPGDRLLVKKLRKWIHVRTASSETPVAFTFTSREREVIRFLEKRGQLRTLTLTRAELTLEGLERARILAGMNSDCSLIYSKRGERLPPLLD